MEGLIEIRWHGRGGQGVVTAAKFLAEATFAQGRYIQAFPEYGAERMGAPVRAFTRISPVPISIYCEVTEPKIVVVLDSSLLGVIDVTQGLLKEGILLVNIAQFPLKVREKIGFGKGKVYTVDATTIALQSLGRAIPNTPMIGALIKVTGILSLEKVIRHFQKAFADKFSAQLIEGNLKAIKRAFEEVRAE